MSKFYKGRILDGSPIAGRVLNDKEILVYSEGTKRPTIMDADDVVGVLKPCTQEEFEQTIREMK